MPLEDLLRPPPHRGPLIAAGAVLLTVGLALLELRLDLGPGVHVLILGAAAALITWLGVQAPNEGGRPPAYQSVLLVCGLLLAYAALLRLADALGGDFDGGPPAGSLVWTGILKALGAGWIAAHRRSAICALISAAAAGVAILAIALQALAGIVIGAVVPFGSAPANPLPGFWEVVVLAAGCGLVAFGAVDRSPGPAWLGVANLGAFILLVAPGGTLR